jgi:hypothetical protein
MGKRKKGAYRYGKAVSFDFRVRHPVVHKPPKNGIAESVPITHSMTEEGRSHLRLPGRVKISGRFGTKDKRPSYAINRVIREKAEMLTKPLPSRFVKADNKVFNKIFNKHKRNKKG